MAFLGMNVPLLAARVDEKVDEGDMILLGDLEPGFKMMSILAIGVIVAVHLAQSYPASSVAQRKVRSSCPKAP